ncbi:VOC family protein [Demequina sp. NBRC 110055]|uniref:VOC family protein n=1 Tax=Demequina sp. NBRC 110055 TaxID=1570344 RepID=UPI000A0324B5|nr:VOC family protein [Demequina sp. NBRC 110055]
MTTQPAHRPDSLAAATGMGAVTLKVADLDAMVAYYRDGVLLELMSLVDGVAVLGRGGVPIVILEHTPDLSWAARGSAGLFHTAIVFDTRAELARSLYSIARRFPGTYTGSADHLVSIAFYMNDPEGNGVELYWDRDRTEWSWTHGQVEMDTLFVDPNAFLGEHLVVETADATADLAPATVGHVHLSVGDVDTARTFYVDALGFDQTFAMPGQALFVSAGGYHHHMAMNVWNSRGAGLRAPALGLGLVRIGVPSADELGEAGERLRFAGVSLADDGRTVSFDDPWANRIELSVTP